MLNLRGVACNPPRTKNILFLWKDITLKVIVKFYVVDQRWSNMSVIEIFYYLIIKRRDTYQNRNVEECSLTH